MDKTLDQLQKQLSKAIESYNAEDISQISKQLSAHVKENIASNPKAFTTQLNIAIEQFNHKK